MYRPVYIISPTTLEIFVQYRNNCNFQSNIIHCADDYNDAQQYLYKRRLIDPPIYNAKRLREVPIPLIPPINGSVSEVEITETEVGDEDEVSMEQIIEKPSNQIDPLAFAFIGSAETLPTDVSNITDESLSNDVKVFIPLIEPNKTNCDAIIDLLDDKEVIEMDGITMIVNSYGIPQPLKSTVDGLIKQENDPISGDIPFQSKVSAKIVILLILKPSLNPTQLCLIFDSVE